MVSDILATHFNYVEEIRSLDCVFCSYTFFKFIVCPILEMFTFWIYVILFYQQNHNSKTYLHLHDFLKKKIEENMMIS